MYPEKKRPEETAAERKAPMKETMIQYFQWNTPADGKLYSTVTRHAPWLRDLGITMLWLPPAYKGFFGKNDTGYSPYDLYDLGEFRQKGSVRTKYGTLKQLLKAVETLHDCRIQVLADIVFDHRMGADKTEEVMVRRMDSQDRNRPVSEPFKGEVYTKFLCSGRKGKYSSFQWNSSCFKATDSVVGRPGGIYLFEGKKWDDLVSREQGNFDYVMGVDVDTSAPYVRDELTAWGRWMIAKTGIDGFRLDAVKSIDAAFFPDWLQKMRKYKGLPAYAVGEYWSGNVQDLKNYLQQSSWCMSLFDVPLHYHFFDVARSSGHGDLRGLADNTLSRDDPDHACTFVDNHDTQPDQALASWVMDWFRTSAYAWILLRSDRVPCVFEPDLTGSGDFARVSLLEEMIWLRAHLLSDHIVDQFDEDPQKACWISLCEHPVVVIMTIGDAKSRTLQFEQLAGVELTDISRPHVSVKADSHGQFTVSCAPGCCSVWIRREDAAWMKRSLSSMPSARRFLHRRHAE